MGYLMTLTKNSTIRVNICISHWETKRIKDKLKEKLDKAKARVKNERKVRLAKRMRQSKEEEKEEEEEGANSVMIGFIF